MRQVRCLTPWLGIAVGLTLAGCPEDPKPSAGPGATSDGGAALVGGSNGGGQGESGAGGHGTTLIGGAGAHAGDGGHATAGDAGGPADASVVSSDAAASDAAADAGPEAQCDPECTGGQICQLVQVQCIRAPCPPLPTCVDDACATVRCKAGTHCVNEAGNASCVGDGAACGNTTCPEGQECCNASCGICTPPGGACIQIACL